MSPEYSSPRTPTKPIYNKNDKITKSDIVVCSGRNRKVEIYAAPTQAKSEEPAYSQAPNQNQTDGKRGQDPNRETCWSLCRHKNGTTSIKFYVAYVQSDAVSMPGFKSMVLAFVCSRIDYCNSLLIGLPKSRLAPLQSVLNAAARLIAHIPRFSHISTFMTEQLCRS